AVFPRVGGPRGRRLLPLHRLVTNHRACLDPAASATPVALPHVGSLLGQSLGSPRTARARRVEYHDRDNVPAPVVHVVLTSPFAGLPALCSCCLRWVHITDFDRQSSLGAA